MVTQRIIVGERIKKLGPRGRSWTAQIIISGWCRRPIDHHLMADDVDSGRTTVQVVNNGDARSVATDATGHP
jgi:hypothetical protein